MDWFVFKAILKNSVKKEPLITGQVCTRGPSGTWSGPTTFSVGLHDYIAENPCCEVFFYRKGHVLTCSVFDEKNLTRIFKKYSNENIVYKFLDEIIFGTGVVFVKCTNPKCSQKVTRKAEGGWPSCGNPTFTFF